MMFGKLIGNIIAAPIRVVNIPLKIADRIADEIDPSRDTIPRLSKPLDVAGDVIAEEVSDALGGD